MKTLKNLVLTLFGLWSLLAVAAELPDRAAFTVAIERGDVGQAREWLEVGLPPDFEGSRVGTGLMIAAWEGNVAMMDLFLSRGANLNKTNALGETAVLHAAWKGNLEAVRWLVERGARLNRDGKEWAALHYATFAGHESVVNYLLERGADVNALSTNGSTPLMMAAREGKESIASRLMSAGAKRDVVNEWGETAVSWAMRNNNVTIARAIATSTEFEKALATRSSYPVRPVRSQPVSDRVDMLLAQARKLEEAGMRGDALKIYRAALANIRRGEAKKAAVVPGRTLSSVVITARRDQPGEQSARLNYATPAVAIAAQEKPDTRPLDLVEDWLRKARELEAAGHRSEALEAYRKASSLLRAR
jgi:hypothetical protein